MSDYPMLTDEQIDEIDDAIGTHPTGEYQVRQLVSMARFSLKAAAEWQGADGRADALTAERDLLAANVAALTEDVAKQRAVIERLERERDEAHRQCHAWAESDKALRAKLEEERAAVGDGIICSVAAWNDVVGRRDQAIADASRLRAENEQLRRDRADVMTDLVARDRENERMRGLLVEALSFATCSGPDLNARYGRYLELCAIAGVAPDGAPRESADASRLREQLRTEAQSSEQYARERDQLRTDRDDWKKECERLRGYLEAVKSERNSLHTELKRVVDIAIDECGMPASAMLGADAPSRAMRKLADENTRLRAENEAMRAVVAAVKKMPDRLLPLPGDWACRECRPESDILVDGFQCQTHALKAALAALASKNGDGE